MKPRLILLAVALMLGACTFVTTQDKAWFDYQAANAREHARRAATNPAYSTIDKTWEKANADAWTYRSDWANGRAPSTQNALLP